MSEARKWVRVAASWSLLAAIVLPAPVVNGQQVGLVDAATVMDSTGKRIGSLQDRKSVFVKLPDNTLVALLVGKDGFVADGLAYGSPDCSGTPYDFRSGTEDGIPVLIPKAAVGPPGNTVYVRPADATPASVTTMSYLQDGDCQPFGVWSHVYPVVPLLDLNTQFTPPFRAVPASAQTCGDCNTDGAVTANEITQVIANVFGDSGGGR